MEQREEEKKFYKICVECTNCFFGKDGLLSKAYIDIPVGQKLVETPCKQCGCKTLKLNSDLIADTFVSY